VIRTGFKHVTF